MAAKHSKWHFDDIRDARVLAAMEKIPRHLFVPENQQDRAYDDTALSIGRGQTISQPFVVAFMTENLHPQPTDKILEIGCGSGYQAAILSELVDHVFSVEIDPVLAEQADSRLEKVGCRNVDVRSGDGFHGWPEEAPFDGIIVTAAVREVPEPLLQQLKEGGRIIIPLGSPTETQDLVLIQKSGDSLTRTDLLSVRFVPFRRNPEI